MLVRRAENEKVRSKNRELEHELERLENYGTQLKDNILDMMADYRLQFEQLTLSIEENNKEIDFLRKQLGEA